MKTAHAKTTRYLPFELVFGRRAISPVDVALGYEGLAEILDPVNFTKTVRQWLQKAIDIAPEKVNKTRDKEAPRFGAKRSPAPIFEEGDLVIEWCAFSGEGLITKLLRPRTGPHKIIRRVL